MPDPENHEPDPFDVYSFKGSHAVVTTVSGARHEGTVKFQLDGVLWVYSNGDNDQTAIRYDLIESVAWQFEGAA